LTAERKNVHVVVFNALVSGEHVVDEPSAHASNFVGTDRCPHSTAAERNSAIDVAGGYGSSQWDHVIRIIVSGARLKRTEVDDLIRGIAQQIRDLFFQNEPSMV
jgi:hypothetical protein